MRYYVIKDGRTHSDFDNYKEAKTLADKIGGEVAEGKTRMIDCVMESPFRYLEENCLSENYRTDMNSTELIAAAKKAMEKELERCIERGTQPSFYTMFLEGYAQGFNEAKELFSKE